MAKINYAHKIAEIICRRYFAQIGFKDLPTKFWNDDRFSRDYHLQIIKANALLKSYSGPAIIAALETKQGSRVYSLGAKWLDPIISQEQIRIDRERRKLEKAIQNTEVNTKENQDTLIHMEGKVEGQNEKTLPKPLTLLEKLG